MSPKRLANATGSHWAGDPIGPIARLSDHEIRSNTATRPFRQIDDGASFAWAEPGTAVCEEGFATRYAC